MIVTFVTWNVSQYRIKFVLESF